MRTNNPTPSPASAQHRSRAQTTPPLVGEGGGEVFFHPAPATTHQMPQNAPECPIHSERFHPLVSTPPIPCYKKLQPATAFEIAFCARPPVPSPSRRRKTNPPRYPRSPHTF